MFACITQKRGEEEKKGKGVHFQQHRGCPEGSSFLQSPLHTSGKKGGDLLAMLKVGRGGRKGGVDVDG